MESNQQASTSGNSTGDSTSDALDGPCRKRCRHRRGLPTNQIVSACPQKNPTKVKRIPLSVRLEL